MPLRSFNRQQTWLLPPTLGELIPDDHPARFVAAFVDALDQSAWLKLGVDREGEALGAPAYDPRALLSVWLFGFMTGTRSCRKLEAACRDQLPYLWLTGWQRPDHNTLWRFYKEHRSEMSHLFKLTVRTAVDMDLVDMAIQAVDGTRIAANAARDRTHDAKELPALLGRAEEAIRQLERENEAGNDPPPPRLPEKLRHMQELRQEVAAALERIDAGKSKNINLTDNDATLQKLQAGNVVPGYSLEAVVSPLNTLQTGLTGMVITAVAAVQDQADTNQLLPMMQLAEETAGKKAGITAADAGFESSANVAACEERHQKIVLPMAEDHNLENPYHKDKFTYDAEHDVYYCPRGEPLRYIRNNGYLITNAREYRCSGKTCRICPALGACTKSRNGRILLISRYDAQLRRHRRWMATKEAKDAYARRKELNEPTFGIIKEQMGARRFLLRGLANVRSEAIVLGTAFNLRTLCHVWQSWSCEKRQMLTENCRI